MRTGMPGICGHEWPRFMDRLMDRPEAAHRVDAASARTRSKKGAIVRGADTCFEPSSRCPFVLRESTHAYLRSS
jgi:hypothetical protein